MRQTNTVSDKVKKKKKKPCQLNYGSVNKIILTARFSLAFYPFVSSISLNNQVIHKSYICLKGLYNCTAHNTLYPQTFDLDNDIMLALILSVSKTHVKISAEQ